MTHKHVFKQILLVAQCQSGLLGREVVKTEEQPRGRLRYYADVNVGPISWKRKGDVPRGTKTNSRSGAKDSKSGLESDRGFRLPAQQDFKTTRDQALLPTSHPCPRETGNPQQGSHATPSAVCWVGAGWGLGCLQVSTAMEGASPADPELTRKWEFGVGV